jgi:hypothetical protein
LNIIIIDGAINGCIVVQFKSDTNLTMAQFIAFNKNVEVNRQTVMSIVNSMDEGRERRMQILQSNNIDPDSKEWFMQQGWLNAFRVIAESLGEMNLFMIGKAIIDHAQFPPIRNLEEGLKSIDIAYHMNHRLDGQVMFDMETGEMTDGIGHYTLASFDAKEEKAIMVCNNPYPSKFDEGIITQVVRKFKPPGTRAEVNLDLSKGSRTMNGDSCTYIITW